MEPNEENTNQIKNQELENKLANITILPHLKKQAEEAKKKAEIKTKEYNDLLEENEEMIVELIKKESKLRKDMVDNICKQQDNIFINFNKVLIDYSTYKNNIFYPIFNKFYKIPENSLRFNDDKFTSCNLTFRDGTKIKTIKNSDGIFSIDKFISDEGNLPKTNNDYDKGLYPEELHDYLTSQI